MIMNYNRKMLLIMFGCFVTMMGYAQQVVVQPDGKIVIDASAIPHTKTKKPRETFATDTSLPEDLGETDIASIMHSWLVYYKFEITKQDYKLTGQGDGWLKAVDYCKDLNSDGTGWRLPTLIEFNLIYLLKPELEKIPDFTPFVSTYTMATMLSSNPTYQSLFNLSDARVAYSHRSSNRPFRCIRDLD